MDPITAAARACAAALGIGQSATPEVTITTIQPQAGDIVMVTSTKLLTRAQAERIRQTVAEQFPRNRVLVLDAGFRVDVVPGARPMIDGDLCASPDDAAFGATNMRPVVIAMLEREQVLQARLAPGLRARGKKTTCGCRFDRVDGVTTSRYCAQHGKR